ncbi:ATP-binding protein [uncultured Dysosmobacter sp.]|uniref:ATP-binding protein n=1 Tax=uncultured Dysosmobacter sp. TaxID=2591384 RepID=UPI0026343C29|nr:ATP-binding protein [uncultured Dysosmobacter sp.]
MNNDLKRLMQSIAEDNMRDARKIVLQMCEKNTTASNRSFCTYIANTIRRRTEMVELPANVAGLLFKEDVSTSFQAARYYLSEREGTLLERILTVNKASERLRAAGISYLNATLLYGASGTGKTMFGRYLAYRLGLPFCYLNLSNMVDSLLGGTSKNMSKVFDYVKGEPCIFMLDELDAISTNRLAGQDSGAAKEMSRATISLMQNLDMLRSDIIVLAATNVIDMVDPAVQRRFPIRHEVKPFTADELLAMAEALLQDVAGQGQFPVEYSAQELKRLCASSAKQSDIVDAVVQSLAKSIETGQRMEFEGA